MSKPIVSASKKKVCVVTSSFPRYKSDRSGIFVYNLVCRLTDNFEIHVIYPSNMVEVEDSSEQFVRHQIPYPFSVYPLSQVKGFIIPGLIRLSFNMIVKLIKVLYKYDISLIHAYWAIPSGFIAALVKGRRPLILTLPGSDIKIFGKKRLFKFPVGYAVRKANKLIVRSNDLKVESLRIGADEKNISIIPAGVNIAKFKPGDKTVLRKKLGLPDCFIVIFAGSLIKIKRIDKIIRVFSNISKNYNTVLVIAGEGIEEERLKKQAYEAGGDKILFKGAIAHDDMPLYMAASDVLVLASDSEGLPGVVQEAMACGIPVVTTNVGGLPEIVTDGFNGFLVNNVYEIQNRLKDMVSSPQLARELGLNALKFAKSKLSIEEVVMKTSSLYTEVLNA